MRAIFHTPGAPNSRRPERTARLLLFLLAQLLLFAEAQPVCAAGLNSLKAPYTHNSIGEPLTALLSDFAISQGYSAAFTSKIEGTVNGDFSALPPRSFLAAMRTGYGVEAYILGSTLHFFHQSEKRRDVLRISSMPPSGMREALLRMGALSEDLPGNVSQKEKLLFIEGPEGYVASLVASIRVLEEIQVQEQGLRIFTLKHAWAGDTNVESATGMTTIPGVASVLRAIATGQPSPVLRTLHRSETSPTLMGGGMVASRQAQEAPAQPPAATGANIIAEPRSNSVIISDKHSRMSSYEAVIAELDKPLDLVEIHAAIMDINASHTWNLGVNWGGARTSGRFSGSAANMGAGASSLGSAANAGFSVSTIYNDNLNRFFADVRALEEKGEGAVLSRPSVLTVDNVQASLEYTTTFYIKLEAERAVDVVPVTSGTTLKVTPRILRMPDGKPSRLSMTIVISDGTDPVTTPQSSWVGGVPPVKKVTINTQATVAEGQSLILGGFYHERRTDGSSGTPGLMNAPVLGYLFGQTSKDIQRMERLILISPRIITYDALDAPIPGRVEAQRFAVSPTAGNYEQREDFYEVNAYKGSGCGGRGAVRPTAPAKQAASGEPAKQEQTP
ncbi:MAG: type III secretion system outer membrane ring subunit SctC [Deltaproteobacteria bacterium]|nr:type III secretion system outer membrane ring subunit SctC [Deltaproteobacteria bacterium]